MKLKKIYLMIINTLILFLFVVMPVLANSADDLVIHAIEATANEDGQGYTIQVNVSVLDSEKNPVEGLTAENFTVTEDSNPVELENVTLSRDLPISVIVLMDNSGSMLGERLRLAKDAISNFIQSMGNGDQVAVYTFSEEMHRIIVFTDDLSRAEEDWKDATIRADAGTCLYDAMYAAVEQAKPLSQGRRAVIVLSDGKDTITGTDVCSAYTEQDIIDKATEGGNNIPVYTIGIGSDIDSNSLQRIANKSGGVYNTSVDNNDLPELFNTLSDQLSSEYVLTYTSSEAPGTHSISVEVGGEVASKDVNFPGLPPIISFAYPSEGQGVSPETTKVSLSVIDRGLPFSSLSFTINGTPIGVGGNAIDPPYEYEIDFSQYANQEITLGIIALDENGVELSLNEIALTIAGVDETPQPVETEDSESAEVAEPTEEAELEVEETPCPDDMVCLGEFQISITQLIIIGVVLVVLTIAIIVIAKLSKKKKGETETEKKVSLFDEDATLDGFAIPNQNIGRLTVLTSDDQMMVGKEYSLVKSPTTLGRSIKNDIAFPKDSAVSRAHAEIVTENGVVYLREILKVSSDGSKTPPTYGTFVNNQKITEQTELKSNDEISLGRRTSLRFESVAPTEPMESNDGISEDVTSDNLQMPDQDLVDDATRDG